MVQALQAGVLGGVGDGVALGVQCIGLAQDPRHVDLIIGGAAIGPFAVDVRHGPDVIAFTQCGVQRTRRDLKPTDRPQQRHMGLANLEHALRVDPAIRELELLPQFGGHGVAAGAQHAQGFHVPRNQAADLGQSANRQ
ncbi:hypothetical protein D3C71_1752300 [compost metagenome]